MSRQTAVAIWALAPIILFTSACSTQKAQTAGAPPSVPVSVAPVTQESVPIDIHAVGRVEPSAVIQVKSLVAGEIVRVAFTEGATVNQGDLLFEIDPRQYQQALRQAEATLARDTAQLHQAEANVNRDKAQAQSADADAARNRQLHQEGLASGSQEEQSRASAEAIRASIAADEAAGIATRALEHGVWLAPGSYSRPGDAASPWFRFNVPYSLDDALWRSIEQLTGRAALSQSMP